MRTHTHTHTHVNTQTPTEVDFPCQVCAASAAGVPAATIWSDTEVRTQRHGEEGEAQDTEKIINIYGGLTGLLFWGGGGGGGNRREKGGGADRKGRVRLKK